jgi:LmbE family N-acetylglucosaminyl deacetylase
MDAIGDLMKKKILIIEPHSDDAMIAAGGYLLKLKEEGNYEFYFVLINASDIVMNHAVVKRKDRIDEYRKYVDFFNGKILEPEIGDYKLPISFDSKLDIFPISILIKFIESIISEVRPNMLMTMAPSFHQDHRIVYEAVVAATRPSFEYSASEILLMENPTYIHELYPNMYSINKYVKLSEDVIDKKIHLIKSFFPSQINEGKRGFLSLASIKKWAEFRGFEARSQYAEAFSIYSQIVD